MTDDEPPAFGVALKAYRTAAGLTQRLLAERAGMSENSVSAHERGVHPTPYRETIVRLAAALGLDSADTERLATSARRSPNRQPARLAPSVPESFPPGSGAQETPAHGNLVIPVSRLIGREAMLTEVIGRCRMHRLVTLVGAGGVGKTRVALEVGAVTLSDFSDGVWFIDLAPLTNGNLAAAAVCAALGLRESAGSPATDVLIASLRQRRLLVILDNCEHVITQAAAVGTAILRDCPHVRILATSRQPLAIAGECVFEVVPLAYPSSERAVTAQLALHYGAVALFVGRASAADQHFGLTDENAPLVSEICRRVDGLALGIELAATRVKVLGLADLARRLDERLRILTGARRLSPPRHKTMRTLIDWSYDLLADRERTLLHRVAIFAGGWTLASAQSICDAAPLTTAEIAHLLKRLVDKSLVVAVTNHAPQRYRLLDSIREYVLEKLAATGERAALLQRHADWVADFAEAASAAQWTTPRRAWLAAISPEIDNTRAALGWALGAGAAPSLAARIAAALSGYWYDSGLDVEGTRWIAAAFAAFTGAVPDPYAAHLWLARAALTIGETRLEAALHAGRSFECLGDRRRLALSSLHRAIAHRQMGQFALAAEAIEEALMLLRETGDERTLYYSSALGWQASALIGLERYDEARVLFETDIALYEELGDEDRAAIERVNYAELEFATANVANALALIDRALDVLRAGSGGIANRNDRFLVAGLLNASACRIVLGESEAALRTARQALALARRIQYPLYAAVALQHVATLAALRGASKDATRLMGFVDATFRRGRVEREPTEQQTYDIFGREVGRTLTHEVLVELAAEGASLDEDRATAIAEKIFG